MKYWLCVLLPAIAVAAVEVRPGGDDPGWKLTAQRAEIAPTVYVDQVHYRTKPGALAISGGSNAAAYGGWEYQVSDIVPGRWYRLTAYYRTQGITYEPLQVLARLDWTQASGKRAGQPDYAYRNERA